MNAQLTISNPSCAELRVSSQGRARGFTLVELVMVMVILGLISIVVLPRLSDTSTFRATAFRSEVVSALRHAQKSAVSHRRLVCVTVRSNGVNLTIAQTYGSTACNGSMVGPDGSVTYASSSEDLITGGTGTIYFQPSGTVSSNASGSAPTNYTISFYGMPAITVVGATGYVN